MGLVVHARQVFRRGRTHEHPGAAAGMMHRGKIVVRTEQHQRNFRVVAGQKIDDLPTTHTDTVFSQGVTSETMEDFAEMAGIECLFIDGETRLRDFRQRLR